MPRLLGRLRNPGSLTSATDHHDDGVIEGYTLMKGGRRKAIKNKVKKLLTRKRLYTTKQDKGPLIRTEDRIADRRDYVLPPIFTDNDPIVLPSAAEHGQENQKSEKHQTQLPGSKIENACCHEPPLDVDHLEDIRQDEQRRSAWHSSKYHLLDHEPERKQHEELFSQEKEMIVETPAPIATQITDREEEHFSCLQEASLTHPDSPLRITNSKERSATAEFNTNFLRSSSPALTQAWSYGPKSIEDILRKQAFDSTSQPYELSGNTAVAVHESSPACQRGSCDDSSNADVNFIPSQSIASFASSPASPYSDWSQKYDWPRFGDGSSRTSPIAESFFEHPCFASSELKELEIKSSENETEAREIVLAMKIANTRLENELEDLKDDHSAETADLNDQIAELTNKVQELRAASEDKDKKLREQKKNDYAKNRKQAFEGKKTLDEEKAKFVELKKKFRPLLLQGCFQSYVNHVLRSGLAEKDPRLAAAFDGTISRLKERCQILETKIEEQNAQSRLWAFVQAEFNDERRRLRKVADEHLEARDTAFDHLNHVQVEMNEISQSSTAAIDANQAENIIGKRNKQLEKQNTELRELIDNSGNDFDPEIDGIGPYTQAAQLRDELDSVKDQIAYLTAERDGALAKFEKQESDHMTDCDFLAQKNQDLQEDVQHAQAIGRQIEEMFMTCEHNENLAHFESFEQKIEELARQLKTVTAERDVLHDKLLEHEFLDENLYPGSIDHPFHWFVRFDKVRNLEAMCKRRGEDTFGVTDMKDLVARGPVQCFREKYREELEEDGEVWDRVFGIGSVGHTMGHEEVGEGEGGQAEAGREEDEADEEGAGGNEADDGSFESLRERAREYARDVMDEQDEIEIGASSEEDDE